MPFYCKVMKRDTAGADDSILKNGGHVRTSTYLRVRRAYWEREGESAANKETLSAQAGSWLSKVL